MTLFSTGIIRVISEPELKEVNDTAVVKFYGGIQEGKDKNGNYINNAIDVEVWGRQANTIMEYVGKGGLFNASGNIRMEEWDDRESGKKRRKHVFKVQRVELLPRAKEDAPTQTQREEAVNEADPALPF